MTTVRRCDLRAKGICGKGARRWFAARGLDWNAFLRRGIDAEKLREGGYDVYAEQAIRAAEDREQAERG